MNIAAKIDEHTPIDNDLVDIGAVAQRDSSAPRIEQRLQVRPFAPRTPAVAYMSWPEAEPLSLMVKAFPNRVRQASRLSEPGWKRRLLQITFSSSAIAVSTDVDAGAHANERNRAVSAVITLCRRLDDNAGQRIPIGRIIRSSS
jgi:hypothetical protein